MLNFFRQLINKPTASHIDSPSYYRPDLNYCADINIRGSELFNFRSDLEDGDECYTLNSKSYYKKDLEENPEDVKFLIFLIGNYDYATRFKCISLEYKSRNKLVYDVIYNNHIYDELVFQRFRHH